MTIVEKPHLRCCAAFFVTAAHTPVRLIPEEFARLASGAFPRSSSIQTFCERVKKSAG
jgi:hypothetical protein